MFPFTYYENLHYSCTTDGDPEGLEWCATQTRAGDNYPLVWGHCSPGGREIDSSSGGGGSSDYKGVIDSSGDGDLMNSSDDAEEMDNSDDREMMDNLGCFTIDALP